MEEEQKDEQKEESEAERCNREREEYLAGWQRAKADFSNYQKDEARRNQEFAKWALASFTRELLSVLDSFEIALTEIKKESDTMGLKLIRSQFVSVLSKHGLEPISAEKGDKFNPEFHEAVLHEPVDQPEDTILEEVQRGYCLHDRILRPSKVKVAAKRREN